MTITERFSAFLPVAEAAIAALPEGFDVAYRVVTPDGRKWSARSVRRENHAAIELATNWALGNAVTLVL